MVGPRFALALERRTCELGPFHLFLAHNQRQNGLERFLDFGDHARVVCVVPNTPHEPTSTHSFVSWSTRNVRSGENASDGFHQNVCVKVFLALCVGEFAIRRLTHQCNEAVQVVQHIGRGGQTCHQRTASVTLGRLSRMGDRNG
jgi:hypothetical protein